ncbi:MAG: twin-arginine translocation signal domain-containing protein, partial [Candidatus Latescibacterota bacterium]
MNAVSRRDFIRKLAIGSAATAAAALIPGVSFGSWEALEAANSDIQWRKTPCRFCGVGCGLLVGLAEGRAVAVKGDP